MRNRRFTRSVPAIATTFCFLSSQTLGSLVVRSDTDSDHLKDESKPTLDSLVAAARTQPSWKFAVEGYTDNTGGEGPQPDALRKAREFSQSLLGERWRRYKSTDHARIWGEQASEQQRHGARPLAEPMGRDCEEIGALSSPHSATTELCRGRSSHQKAPCVCRCNICISLKDFRQSERVIDSMTTSASRLE